VLPAVRAAEATPPRHPFAGSVMGCGRAVTGGRMVEREGTGASGRGGTCANDRCHLWEHS